MQIQKSASNHIARRANGWIGDKKTVLLGMSREVYQSTRLAASHAQLVVAGTAIDRPIIFRQERNLRLDSTLSANHRMHLAGSALRATAPAPFCTALGAASGATARLIHQTFLLVKFLFACGESEVISTVAASKGLVNETQNQGLLVI